MNVSRFAASVVIGIGLNGLLAGHALGTTVTYPINANGIKEVNVNGVPSGDSDGTAVGTLTLDNVAGSATISLTLANIDLSNLTGNHIHNGPSTTTGPIVLDFGDPDNIRTGSVLNGTITGLSVATINSVFLTPTAFYYNLHNGAFPAGAVRDQLPEPASLALLATGATLALRRRRA